MGRPAGLNEVTHGVGVGVSAVFSNAKIRGIPHCPLEIS